MNTKTIYVNFSGLHTKTTDSRSQYDYGQVLKIGGRIELPQTFEAHFCNVGDKKTKLVVGQDNVVEIPDEYIEDGRNILCYIFLHDGESDGRTMYTIEIPIEKRAKPTANEPTPVQQDAITQAIASLNNAINETSANVEITTENATSAKESADSARVYAESASESANSASESAESASVSATNAEASAVMASNSESNAESSASTAIQKASEASASASMAEQSADRAEQLAKQSGYMFFYIDEHGDLIYHRTSNVQVDFYLNNGDLYMRGSA